MIYEKNYDSQRTIVGSKLDYKLVKVFLLLAVLEGVVGKWISPALEYLPVFFRDIVAMTIIWRAFATGRINQYPDLISGLLIWSVVAVIYSFVQEFIFGFGFAVMAIGLRFWVLYFWVAYAICCILDQKDFIEIGNLSIKLLWLMFPLLMAQNQAGVDAWINKGTVDDAYVFVVSGDIVRTTGTFSFTLGFTCFLGLVSPMLLASGDFKTNKNTPWYLNTVACFILLVACSVISGSRGVFLMSAAFIVVGLLMNFILGSTQSKTALIGTGVAVVFLAILPIFLPETFIAIEDRILNAQDSESFVTRVQDTLIGTTKVWQNIDFLGQGLGFSANMSAKFVGFSPSGDFVLAEIESERILLAGGILGLLLIFIKLVFLSWMFNRAMQYAALSRSAFPILSWTLTAMALTSWPMSGQLAAQSIGTIALSFSLMSIGIFSRVENIAINISKL